MSSWNDTRFATAILCPAPLRAIWDQKSRRFVTENIELKSLVNDWHNYRIEIEFLNTHYGVDANGVTAWRKNDPMKWPKMANGYRPSVAMNAHQKVVQFEERWG